MSNASPGCMYQDYFRLAEPPFSIAPDPRFLYMGARHREAIAHLLFGVGGAGGLVLLTGEVGTGKTTLCRRLIEQIHASCDVAVILNPKLGAKELLETICNEFQIAVPVGRLRAKTLTDVINAHLLAANAAGRRAVLIVDEAQNLHPAVLEQLRLLTNLETNTRKLLQIVLIGQPELNDLLARPEMRQVAQRIVARYHLAHLTHYEVAAYVSHRLRVAGAQAPLIPPHLMLALYRATGGVPRLINLVCDRALLGAYVQGKMQVTRPILKQAAREVFGPRTWKPAWSRLARQLALLSALAGSGAFLAYSFPQGAPAGPAAVPVPAVPAPAAAVAPALPPEPAATQDGSEPTVVLALGARGPEVALLRHNLTLLSGAATAGSARFDDELRQRVKLFQAAEGIAADGIVGPQTLARIHLRLKPDVLHP